jgi:hypothetical protein
MTFKVGYQWLTSAIIPTWEAEIGRIMVRGQFGQRVPISKITRAKWTGGEAQLMEHLLSKHQV